MRIFAPRNQGVLAQLVERLNGIQKVRSSILLCSTTHRQPIGNQRLPILFCQLFGCLYFSPTVRIGLLCSVVAAALFQKLYYLRLI